VNVDKLAKQLLKYPNVTGYSKKLRKRIKNGKVVEEWCIQVHVSKKVPLKELKLNEVIPVEVEGIPVDVVDVGELRALSVDKTKKFRPLQPGISIGNYAITAGTLGNFVFGTKKPFRGEVLIASNAHVLCDNPSFEKPKEIDIVQPGRYDGGTHNDKVGEYRWHQRIKPLGSESSCPILTSAAKAVNWLLKKFKRKSRISVYTEEANHIDFAVASIDVPYMFKHADKVFDSSYECIGYGFAGSDKVSLVCKGKYIEQEGFLYLDYQGEPKHYAEGFIGDVVEKSSRNCWAQAEIIDDSAYEIVSYGSFYAAFDDVIITSKLLDPGCSGSAVYRKITEGSLWNPT